MSVTSSFTASTKESNGVQDYFLGHNYYLVRKTATTREEIKLTKFVMTKDYAIFINNDSEVRLALSDLQDFDFRISDFLNGDRFALVKFTKNPHKFLGEVSSLQIFDKTGDDLVNLGITGFLFENVIDEQTKESKQSFTLMF